MICKNRPVGCWLLFQLLLDALNLIDFYQKMNAFFGFSSCKLSHGSAQGQRNAAAVDAVAQRLQAIKGIGPWTVNYCLLRGYGWPDGSLHGDVAVRRAIGLLMGVDKPDARFASDWLEQFKPWRALVAAHLWASLSDSAY